MKSGKTLRFTVSFGSFAVLSFFAFSAMAEDTPTDIAPPAPIEAPPVDALAPPNEELPPPVQAEQKVEEKHETAAPAPVVDIPVSDKSQAEIRMERGSDYQLIRPMWATEFSYSPGALGRTNLAPETGSVTAKAFTLSFQFQPTGIQRIGVFSVGPTVSVYPLFSNQTSVTNNFYSIWSAGIAGRYQARLVREQILVPVAGLNIERFNYHKTNNLSGAFPLSGPMLGVNLLLNPLEPNAAFDFYANTGVLRSYLTAEAFFLKGSDANLNISGTSIFVGLRVEF